VGGLHLPIAFTHRCLPWSPGSGVTHGDLHNALLFLSIVGSVHANTPHKKMEGNTMSLDLIVAKDGDDDLDDTVGDPEPGSDDNSGGPAPDAPAPTGK
jgi:hypothetical protein